MEISKKHLERLVILSAFLFVVVISYLGYAKGVLVKNPWTIGDWLINYHAGFIRRGFIGQLAIQFPDPALFILVLQIICYSAILVFFFLSIKARNYPIEFFLIAITPFLFMFPVLDPQGRFRKEIIGIALVAMSCWARLSLNIEKRRIVFLSILALFPFLILTHELLAIFLFIIAILNRDIKLSNTQVVFSLVMVGASCVAFLFCARYDTITHQDMTLICEPLKDFCSQVHRKNGAITALLHSSEYGYERVVSTHFNLKAMLKYLAAVILMLPIIYLTRSAFAKSVPGTLPKALFFIFTLGLLSMHFVARDYGRFIHIWLFCYVLLSLTGVRVSEEGFIKIRPWYLVFLGVYFPFWYIDHMYTFTLTRVGELIAH